MGGGKIVGKGRNRSKEDTTATDITGRRTLCQNRWTISQDFVIETLLDEVGPSRNTTDECRLSFLRPARSFYSLSRVAAESQVNGMSGYFGAVYLLFFFICVYRRSLLSLFPFSICLFLTFIRFLGARVSFFCTLPFSSTRNSRLLASLPPPFPFRFL